MNTVPDVTALLEDWTRGNRSAFNQLLPLVYTELRAIAGRQLRAERVGHTLQPTALVHEMYLRLVDQRKVGWQGRAHFFGVAARVMRRILVDHARRHGAAKRNAADRQLSLDGADNVPMADALPLIELDDALDRLEAIDRDAAQVVELRAFGGLTIEETAEALKVSPSTAKRQWRFARAWLHDAIGGRSRP